MIPAPDSPDPKLITLAEAAEILAVHPLTVRRAIDAGRLRAYRLGNTARPHIRLDRADVLALLEPIEPTAVAK